ncbi:MAG: CBS domain-containing protein [Azovibrio sp.]|uniref:CBS domain-containing protein n=1 Tax=Azovibrio sp. TaxID=1872673 RepID=UPI003C739004
MQTLTQLLEDKGGLPIVVSPRDNVYHALSVMADNDVGAVLVMDGEKLVGIFSERDYARKVILSGRNSRETMIEAVMTHKVAYVTQRNSIEECMSLMTQHRFRHLPVLDEDLQVLGVISMGDLVKATISHQEFIISQLERYISG